MRTDVLISMQILHVCCARQHDAAFFTCAAEERERHKHVGHMNLYFATIFVHVNAGGVAFAD